MVCTYQSSQENIESWLVDSKKKGKNRNLFKTKSVGDTVRMNGFTLRKSSSI